MESLQQATSLVKHNWKSAGFMWLVMIGVRIVWAIAPIIGLPFFFVVNFSPIFLVSGWGQIYQSSVWTLTYRELKALDMAVPAMIETK